MQADTEFGVTPGAGRVCGAALNGSTAVNQLSYDPDTADGDSIVPIQNTGAFYSPTQYKLVRSVLPLRLGAFAAAAAALNVLLAHVQGACTTASLP